MFLLNIYTKRTFFFIKKKSNKPMSTIGRGNICTLMYKLNIMNVQLVHVNGN